MKSLIAAVVLFSSIYATAQTATVEDTSTPSAAALKLGQATPCDATLKMDVLDTLADQNGNAVIILSESSTVPDKDGSYGIIYTRQVTFKAGQAPVLGTCDKL